MPPSEQMICMRIFASCEILFHPSPKQSNPRLMKQKKKRNQKEKYLRQRGRETFALHYRNDDAFDATEEANEPVDPATEQNQWSFWPGY